MLLTDFIAPSDDPCRVREFVLVPRSRLSYLNWAWCFSQGLEIHGLIVGTDALQMQETNVQDGEKYTGM